MKRLLLSLFIALIFISCGEFFENEYDVSITNKSSKTVSYTFNSSVGSVLAGEEKVYTVSRAIFNSDMASLENVKDQNGLESVNIDKSSARNFIFTDADLYNLSVVNTLPIPLTIKSGNRINNSGSTELTISGNSENNSAKIYMPISEITSSTNYLVIIDKNVSGNTMYIVLR